MAGSTSGEIKAEPNLTPLLDVVFQLITFFMLVINFSADTFDQRVRLPVAPTATPPESKKDVQEDRLVFNINKDGMLYWQGQVLDAERTKTEIQAQAKIKKVDAERERKRAGKPEDGSLPTTIVIRSDRDTQFSEIFRFITACQANGFTKFSLKAMTDKG